MDSFEDSSRGDSIGQDDYPAVSFPGYAEKPLTEQLEPIAVVGMGGFRLIDTREDID